MLPLVATEWATISVIRYRRRYATPSFDSSFTRHHPCNRLNRRSAAAQDSASTSSSSTSTTSIYWIVHVSNHFTSPILETFRQLLSGMLTRRGLLACHIRPQVLARTSSYSSRLPSLGLVRDANTGSQVRGQPHRMFTHSAVRSEEGSIPHDSSSLSSLKGKATSDEADGRPEHAVISTFDLFSIGGAYTTMFVEDKQGGRLIDWVSGTQ